LAEKVFKIRKGFWVGVFENSKMIYVDQVSGFHVGCRGDQAYVYFSLVSGKSQGEFFVLARSRKELQQVSMRANIAPTPVGQSQMVKESTWEHFFSSIEEEKLDLNTLFTRWPDEKERIFSNDEKNLGKELKQMVDMKVIQADLNADKRMDFLVTASAKRRPRTFDFTAIVMDKHDNVFWLKLHGVFRQIVTISNQAHIVLEEYTPNTGDHRIVLYQLNNTGAQPVFTDGSYGS